MSGTQVTRLAVATVIVAASALAILMVTRMVRAQWWDSAPAGDAIHGQQLALAKCSACHGADGNSRNQQYPNLAGQKPAYLYRQLQAFKKGTRKSLVMSPIVAPLSDSDLANVAAYFSEQVIQPDAIQDRTLASAGERIFFTPQESGTLACASCHGEGSQGGMPMMGMTGGGMMGPSMRSYIPNLYGQHAAYLASQLTRFADGTRPAMMMDRIAAALTPSERKAVAAYLSGMQ